MTETEEKTSSTCFHVTVFCKYRIPANESAPLLTTERKMKEMRTWTGGGEGNGGSLIRIFICQKTLLKVFQLPSQEGFFTNIFSPIPNPLLACKRSAPWGKSRLFWFH